MILIRLTCSIILILSVKCDKTDALRILGLFPLPVRSHYTTGETLLKELARRGHIIDVVSHFPQKKKINNYNDIDLAGSIPMITNNTTIQEIKSYTRSINVFIEKFGRNVSDLLGHPNFQKLMNAPRGTYDVIIVELTLYPSYIAFGQQLGAPVVGLIASKLHPWLYGPFGNVLNPSYTPGLHSILAQRMTFWERLQNTLVHFIVCAQTNYYLQYEIKQVEKYFNRKLLSLNELYDDVSLLLVNEHFSLNYIKPLTPDIIGIGGLHIHDSDKELEPDLQKWLDESTEGCVYFTFGSILNIESMPERILRIFHETFQRIAPVRVLLRMANASAFSDGLPNNVKISSWLPQVAVLKHNNTKAFITHGGLLGTQEAVAYKVPMIGLPIFADQPSNIKNYAHHKIAIALSIDTVTADSLTNAINSVLKDPVYRKNMEEVSDLFLDRPMSPLETAVYWVQYTARHGKVLKSPATQLTWWQLNLLDVYGFITISSLVIIISIKISLTFLWKSVRKSFSKNVSETKKIK